MNEEETYEILKTPCYKPNKKKLIKPRDVRNKSIRASNVNERLESDFSLLKIKNGDDNLHKTKEKKFNKKKLIKSRNVPNKTISVRNEKQKMESEFSCLKVENEDNNSHKTKEEKFKMVNNNTIEELKNKSGIYLYIVQQSIEEPIKSYVGITNNFNRRYNEHLKKSKKHKKDSTISKIYNSNKFDQMLYLPILDTETYIESMLGTIMDDLNETNNFYEYLVNNYDPENSNNNRDLFSSFLNSLKISKSRVYGKETKMDELKDKIRRTLESVMIKSSKSCERGLNKNRSKILRKMNE
jgi:methionine-rich copper-binding protein CopC